MNFIIFYLFIGMLAYWAANGLQLYQTKVMSVNKTKDMQRHLGFVLIGLVLANCLALIPLLLPQDARIFGFMGGVFLAWLVLTNFIILILPPHEYMRIAKVKELAVPFITQSQLWPNLLIPAVLLLDYSLMASLSVRIYIWRVGMFTLAYLITALVTQYLMYSYKFSFNKKIAYIANIFLFLTAIAIFSGYYN